MTLDINDISDEIAGKILAEVFDVTNNQEEGIRFHLNSGECISIKRDPEHFNYALERVATWKGKETKRLCDNIIYACAVAATKYEEPIPYITAFWSEIFNGTRDTNNPYYDEPSQEVVNEIENKIRPFVMPFEGDAVAIEDEFKGNEIASAMANHSSLRIYPNTKIDHQIRRAKVTPYLANMITQIPFMDRKNQEMPHGSLEEQNELIKRYLPQIALVIAEQAKLMSMGISPASWDYDTDWWTKNGVNYSSAVFNHYYCNKRIQGKKDARALEEYEDAIAMQRVANEIQRGDNPLTIDITHSPLEALNFMNNINEHVRIAAISGLKGLPVQKDTMEPYY